tara:strand:+ start:5382 stop:6371 length:990 start_codon:yes stop_codon:yes gene_type:complete
MNLTKNIVDQMVLEVLGAAEDLDLIVERTMPVAQDTGEKSKVLKLPKFALSEKWGSPSSEDRQIIEKFFANIEGDTLQEKINSVQAFIKDCDISCINEAKVEKIIANLVFLDSLAGVIEDFNNQTGGFMFEALLAALIKGTQVTDLEGGALPIEDLVDSDGKTPLSLKFLFGGKNKVLAGSYKNLRDGIARYQKPITYIVGVKEREGQDILGVDFYQFTIGDKAQTDDDGNPIVGDFDYEQFKAKQIKSNDYKDKLIARLDFGSRGEIKDIADKYVARLGDRIVDIFDSFASLTKNLNTYFTDFENKTVAAKAAQDALNLEKSVNKNID